MFLTRSSDTLLVSLSGYTVRRWAAAASHWSAPMLVIFEPIFFVNNLLKLEVIYIKANIRAMMMLCDVEINCSKCKIHKSLYTCPYMLERFYQEADLG